MSEKPIDLVARASIEAKRGVFSSQLLIAEHELAGLKKEIAEKEKAVEQWRGAIQACDQLLRMPPYEAPVKKEPEPAPKETQA
jgi:hypothetical protein